MKMDVSNLPFEEVELIVQRLERFCAHTSFARSGNKLTLRAY
ncbi:MAG: hypothetical protein ABIH99_02150 [Candidatus Micrarchaeota archaeon]